MLATAPTLCMVGLFASTVPTPESRLGARLAEHLFEGTLQTETLARSERRLLGTDRLRVEVMLHGATSRADLVRRLRAGGASVEVEAREAFQAVLSRQQAWWLVGQPGVHRVRFATFPRPETTSEGLSMMGIARARDDGLDGTGVHVLVMDSGFEGYEALQGSELPTAVTTFSLAEEGFDTRETAHGTKCAEIVHDVAPGAQLTLATAETTVEWLATFEWAAAQPQFDIVTFSHGWDDNFPLDGTSALSRGFEAIALSGKLVIKSAGNRGNKMVTRALVDEDGDGVAELTEEDGLLPLYVNTNDDLNIDMRWNEPFGSAAVDLQLCVLDEELVLLSCSNGVQDGSGDPTERLFFRDPGSGPYFAQVRCDPEVGCPQDITVRVSTTEWRERELTDRGLRFTRRGTISVPGDAPSVLTVGAIGYARHHRSVTPYSSEGPTEDGRQKPEVFGPSHVSTSQDRLDTDNGFTGTSAAAPHVAGLAALKRQANPSSTVVELRQAIIEDVDPGHRGDLFGSGLAFYALDRVDCEAECSSSCGDVRGCACGGCPGEAVCDRWGRCVEGRPLGDACTLARAHPTAGACREGLECHGDDAGRGVCALDIECMRGSSWRNYSCIEGSCLESYCLPPCDADGACPEGFEAEDFDGACACAPESWGCIPDCEGRSCGPDRCGGLCGSCDADLTCDAAGTCACPGACRDVECGLDPVCGRQSCGECADNQACVDGACLCQPDCNDRECGLDPVCKESCGVCPDGTACFEDGRCRPPRPTPPPAADVFDDEDGCTCTAALTPPPGAWFVLFSIGLWVTQRTLRRRTNARRDQTKRRAALSCIRARYEA